MKPSHPPAPPFSTHAQDAVRSLRSAFSDVIVAAGADPHSPQSVGQTLGLNKNLAWKLSRIVQADDPASVLELMPGGSGIKILLSAIESSPIDPALVTAARTALEDYERLIEVHSGDRLTLEMMGSELSTTGRAERDEQHRKLLYQGASYVWGAQSRVVLKVGVVTPGEDDGLLDFASLSGFFDFRRLRPDVTWVMARRQSTNDDGSEMDPPAVEPLDTDYQGQDGAPLMPDFCSDPIPRLRRIQDGTAITYELAEGRVGNTGALTCVTGAVQRRIPYYRTPTNERGIHSARCDIPAELLLVDLFIHKDLAFDPPTAQLRGDVGVPAGRPGAELPLHEPIRDLGASSVPPPSPDVPRYRQMLEAVFHRVGHDPGEYRGYRMRLAYPPYPTVLLLSYPLPDPPQ